MKEPTRYRYTVEKGVASIVFSRPERLNALDDTALEELAHLAAVAVSDPGVRSILLTGEGRGFCAGADLKFLLERALAGVDEPIEAMFRKGAMHIHQAIADLRRTGKPVVSAVNGPAAGAGVGLALAGDIVWTTKEATFTLAYTKIGLAPDGSTTYAVTRAVGEKKALELFLTGDTIPAQEALALGLVTRVFDTPGELLAEAKALAERLAQGPTIAY